MRVIFSLAFVLALTAGSAFADGGLTSASLEDVNGDGVVNVSGDGSALVAGLSTDILGPGGGLAVYYPLTGLVKISTNNAGFIEVSSSIAQLIPANAVPTNSAGLGASFSDPFTTSTINYLSFSALGTAGILDSYSIGAILPTGISDPSGNVPNALFRWSVVGGGEFQGPVHIAPEPTSFALAGFAGVVLVACARRRRAK